MIDKPLIELIELNVSNEAELRSKWFTYFEKLKIPLRLETHPSKGSLLRLDASYNYTIIEFKSPRSFRGNHQKALNAINQLRIYIRERALNEKQPIDKYSGVYTDGEFAGIIQFTKDNIDQEIQSVSPLKTSIEKIPYFKNWGKLDQDFTTQIIDQIRNGFSLFSATNLIGLFGHDSDFSKKFQLNFAKYLQYDLSLPNSSIKPLFTEWKKLFVQIASPSENHKGKIQEKYRDILELCKLVPEELQLPFVLFVIHTYNYFVTRILAAELISATKPTNFSPPGTIQRFSAKILHDRTARLHDLLDANLENVSHSILTNLCSFQQIPFFSWYLDAFKGSMDANNSSVNDIAVALQKTTKKLARDINMFDLASVHLVVGDVLKQLYQNLVSPELRRSLGEYYTPNWMTRYMIDECVSIQDWRDKRVLDPTCGSGSFLLEAIRKKRMAYSQLDEKCYTAKDIDCLLKLKAKFSPNKRFKLIADKLIYVLPSTSLNSQALSDHFNKPITENNSLLKEMASQKLSKKMEITILCPCVAEQDQQWYSLEIKLSRINNRWSAQFYLHDTHGKGKLEEMIFTSLENSMKIFLKSLDDNPKFQDFHNIESPYESIRQCRGDKSASGPIVVEELIKLIDNYTLNVDEQYGIGASEIRIKHFYDLEKALENNEQSIIDENTIKNLFFRLKDDDLFTDITRNVWGFDLNPLAVQIASLNFMIANIDLIRKCWNLDFKIPVALADALYFPSKEKKINEEKTQDVYPYEVPHLKLDVSLPAELVEKRFDIFEAFVNAMNNREIKLPKKFDDFLRAYLRRNLTNSQDSQNHEVLSELDIYKDNLEHIYNQIYKLRANNQDGIWLQIIRSFLVAVRAGQFDVVLANPPWIGWSYLPEEYRNKVARTYGEKYPSLMKGLEGKRNIAAIIIHTTADKWLNIGGQIAVVIPTSLLQDKAQVGFRRFELGGSHILRPEKINVFKTLYLFDNTYHEASILSAKKYEGKVGNFKQIPCIEWEKNENGTGTIEVTLPIEEVLKRTRRTQRVATPFNNEPGSRWSFNDKEDLNLDSFKGQWPLEFKSGIDTGANAIYFVSLETIINRMARIKLKDGETVKIEAKFIYRLIKGAGNIKNNYLQFDNDYVIIPNKGTGKINLQDAANELQKKSSNELLDFLKRHQEKLKSRSLAKNDHNYWWKISKISDATFFPYKVLYPEIIISAAGFRAAVSAPITELNNEVNNVYIPDHKIYFVGFKENQKNNAYYLAGLLNCEIVTKRVEGSASGLSVGNIIKSGILPGLPKYEAENKQCTELASQVESAHQIAEENEREVLVKNIDTLAKSYLLSLHSLQAAGAAPNVIKKGSITSFFPVTKQTDTDNSRSRKIDADENLPKKIRVSNQLVSAGKMEVTDEIPSTKPASKFASSLFATTEEQKNAKSGKTQDAKLERKRHHDSDNSDSDSKDEDMKETSNKRRR